MNPEVAVQKTHDVLISQGTAMAIVFVLLVVTLAIVFLYVIPTWKKNAELDRSLKIKQDERNDLQDERFIELFRSMQTSITNDQAVIAQNSEIIQNTEEMHRIMDEKIESIREDVEVLKEEVIEEKIASEKILKILDGIERKIDDLGKPTIHKGGEDHG